MAAVVATFTGKSRFCRVAWWTADPGSADGKGGRRRRRRRDEKRRSTHLHQSDWLARSASALFHSFPWNKGRKEKSRNQKTELQDQAGTKYQARGRQSDREKFHGEGMCVKTTENVARVHHVWVSMTNANALPSAPPFVRRLSLEISKNNTPLSLYLTP